MTPFDWLIVAVFVVSVVLAAEQGFVFELMALGGVVVGYLVAAWNYARLAPRFLPFVKSAPVAELAGFLTIFFVVLLLAGIAGRVARWLVKQAGLHWFDRVLGGVFGVVRGAAIVVVLVLGIATFSPGTRVIADSRFGEYFLVAARAAAWVAPSSLRQRLRGSVDQMHRPPVAPSSPQQPGAADGKEKQGPAPRP